MLVLGLGGALGTGAYFLSDFDTRDLIAYLDVGDPQGPHLKLQMPGHGDGEAKGDAALDRVGSERTVDVHVRRLRLHLGEDAYLLRTMTRIGYRLDPG